MNLLQLKKAERDLKHQLRDVRSNMFDAIANELMDLSEEEIQLLATYAAHMIAKTGADPRGIFGPSNWTRIKSRFSE